jgi:predicted MFS family arabinose efflux permease
MSAHRHRTRRLRKAVSRYRAARKTLHTPASPRSRHGLDWMNFFIADVQTGFGTFVAFYLADLGWSRQNVGLALATGGIAGVIAQAPGGALTDAITWKRGLAALGILMLAGAALTFALTSSFTLLLFGEILHGLTAGIITPAIAAISLGLVGRRSMALRTGRNYRFAAAGSALTALIMGLVGTFISVSSIFFITALLCIPALLALATIRGEEIDYARARNAVRGKQRIELQRVTHLARNRTLLLFTGCLILFQLADASMLPLIGEGLAVAKEGAATLWISALIVIPQIIVAMLSPWIGYHSEAKGRRPLLLIGFAVEPVRALLLAWSTQYPALVVVQLLGGISAAIINVLTIVVITDLTAGTGRFNLARGIIGTMTAIAASLSTALTGYIDQAFGQWAAFTSIAALAGAATLLIWVFLTETKPAQYEE